MVEALSAPGPLSQAVDVMVRILFRRFQGMSLFFPTDQVTFLNIYLQILYQHPNPGIKYEYTIQIPADEDTPAKPELLHANSSSARHQGPPNRQPHRARPEQDDNSISAPAQKQSPPKDADEVVDNGIDQRSRQDPEKFPFGPGVLATESEKPHQPHGSPRHRRRRFLWQIVKYTPCTKPCAGKHYET